MNGPVRAVSHLPQAIAWQRATIVRALIEAVSAQTPLAEIWPDAAAALAALTHARTVTIVMHGQPESRTAYRLSAENEPRSSALAEALACDALATNEIVRKISVEPRLEHLGVPIRFGSAVLGAMCLEFVADTDPELLSLLDSCALSIGTRLHTETMIEDTARYERLASIDALTGIANRRCFDETLEREWSRALRAATPLTLLIVDIDFFKSYNDTYGHPAGDACLRRVAQCLAAQLQRPGDLAARYGGEEFVMLLPGIDAAGGAVVGESLIGALAELSLPHHGSSLERVTLSAGVASLVPARGTAAADLVAAADEALYEAKHAGRNRVHGNGYAVASGRPTASLRRSTSIGNVPVAATPIIGRVREMAEIRTALEHSRLVTISACGGAGKTRISLAVATKAAGEFADGAWFVDLAPLQDGAAIPTAVATVFSVDVPTSDDGAASLARALAAKHALLVVDNCEHLIGPVADVLRALIAGCPQLRILATSREAVGIRGESVYRLPLLAFPTESSELDAATALTYDAVALFAERAGAVRTDFAVTDDNAATIARICRQLDGISLAIELAAARVAVIGVNEIEQRLAARFALLSGGDRTALPRQQTMRALIDWSYDLLAIEERTMLARLSVFVGGWTLTAMTRICADDQDEFAVLDILSGLVRKSLVVDRSGDQSRYTLLESVREYAREKHDAYSDRDEFRRRHARYYLKVANGAKTSYLTTPSKVWLRSVQPELDNFRAALEWTLNSSGDVVLGAALAASLVVVLMQTAPHENLRWTRRALELLPPDSDARIEAALWFGVGRSSENVGAPELRAASERAVALARTTGDRALLAETLRHLVMIVGLFFPAEHQASRLLAAEAIELARTLGEPSGIALALRSASSTIDPRDTAAIFVALEESLALLLAHGNDTQIAIAYMWLAERDFCIGTGRKAAAYAREGLRLAQESGAASLTAQMAANAAQYAMGADGGPAAARLAVEAALLARPLQMDDQVTWAVQAVAFVIARHGDAEIAARLLGFCDARAAHLHSERQSGSAEEIVYRRLAAALGDRIDAQSLDALLASGSRMTESDAIAACEAFVQP